MFFDGDLDFKKDWSDASFLTKLAQKHIPLKKDEERALLDTYFNSNTDKITKQKIKDTVILKNLRIIIKHAKHSQFMGKGVPLSELIHEGILGLIYCLDRKYDHSKGMRLLTLGVAWIRQFLGRACENKSRLVKIPLHIQGKINKVRTVYRDFINDSTRPSAEEISVRIKDKYNLDISPDEVEELGRLQYPHSSLDDSDDDNQATLLDFVTVNNSDEIHEASEKSLNRKYIQGLLRKLTHKEAQLIIWKFGLIDYNSKRTSKEMAKILGMSLVDYKQFENQTIARLRSIADINKVCW